MDEMQHLMPQAKRILIGKKEYDLFPLSLKDQRQVTDLILTIIKVLITKDGDTTLNIIERLASAIMDKVPEILSTALKIDKAEVEEITNDQLFYVIDIILDDNYGDVQKKIEKITEKVKSVFLSQKSSQASANTTDTPLKEQAILQESK